MPIEFVVRFNKNTFPNTQDLPEIYREEGFRGNNEIYLSSPQRYHFKVGVRVRNNAPTLLYGAKWSKFTQDNFNLDVEWLHFVEEGDDSFYVTGYYEIGIEVIEYRGIDIRNIFPRFMIGVLPYDNLVSQTMHACFLKDIPADNEIWINGNDVYYNVQLTRVRNEGVECGYEYHIDENAWRTMVEDMHLTPEMIVVLMKKDADELWLTDFGEDGNAFTEVHFHGAITLRPLQRELSDSEKADDRMKHHYQWKWHTEHFGEGIDMFYKDFSRILPLERLAIPADFLRNRPMHFYTRALMIHQDKQQLMRMNMEFHPENPSRRNHVNVYGQWKEFAKICNFGNNKLIRFKFMRMEADPEGGWVHALEYPVFHLC